MSDPGAVPALPALSAFQDEIYLGGLLHDQRPPWTTDLTLLQREAADTLPPESRDYLDGAAGTGSTMRANRDAFDRRALVPRMQRDVSVRELGCDLFGVRYPAPVLLAPIGVLGIVHPDAEPAVARAAAGLGLPFVLSTAASSTIEEVAGASGDGPRWFQLYRPRADDVAVSLLRRARAAGYTALVVTLDTRMLGWRPRDLDRAYLPFLRRAGIANYLSDPAFLAGLPAPVEEDPLGAVAHWARMFADPGRTWDDLAFVRAHWDGPVLVKGILHPDDARLALDAGMDGVVVSNHGGRQVDGAIAALDALPAVADAVGDRMTVLLDSGVRGGADIVKALALGARAVMVGRPYAYGLAVGGEAGVRHVLRCLLAELDLTLALTGHASAAALGPGALAGGGRTGGERFP